MSEQMDHIMDTYIEVWSTGTTDLLDEIAAENVIRRAGTFDSIDGREALKTRITEFRTAFPDSNVTIQERAHGPDFTLCIWTYTGTNTGPGDFPATGRQVSVTGSTLARIRDGKMVEEHVYFDTAEFLGQLGVEIPQPATA